MSVYRSPKANQESEHVTSYTGMKLLPSQDETTSPLEGISQVQRSLQELLYLRDSHPQRVSNGKTVKFLYHQSEPSPNPSNQTKPNHYAGCNLNLLKFITLLKRGAIQRVHTKQHQIKPKKLKYPRNRVIDKRNIIIRFILFFNPRT